MFLPPKYRVGKMDSLDLSLIIVAAILILKLIQIVPHHNEFKIFQSNAKLGTQPDDRRSENSLTRNKIFWQFLSQCAATQRRVCARGRGIGSNTHTGN